MTGFIPVADPDDPRLAMFRLNERGLSSRTQRRDDRGDGWFIAEGDLVVERALAAGCAPVMALSDAARPDPVARRLAATVPVFVGDEPMRRLATQNGVVNSLLAIFERPARPSVAELATWATHLVVAEAVDNPVNIGSIVRNAAGLGWHGLVLDRTSADPLARRALRVSMGHAVAFPHARAADLPAALRTLVDAGFSVVALTPAPDACDLDAVSHGERVALVIGSERGGLGDAALGAATHRVRIPMAAGVDSLNAAAASAVACHVLRPRA
jgi:tRNA G18 (ribose-2'-O)-methylase SpoU